MNCHTNVILFLKHIGRPGAHHFNALALHLLIWPWKQRCGWKLAYIWCQSSFVLESADLQARSRADSRTTSSVEKGDVASSSHCHLPDLKELLCSAEIVFKSVCKQVVGVNQGGL